MAYATLAELKSYLGIATDLRTDDALLTSFLSAAQAAINSHCHRVFESSTDTTHHFGLDAIGGRVLYLDADLCVITSVVNGDGITVGASAYVTEPRNSTPYHALALKYNSDVWWDGLTGEIAVTGKWAYSTTAPADVAQACVRLAAWMYRGKDNTGNDQPMIAGNVTILPARIPSDVEQMLAPYVRLLV